MEGKPVNRTMSIRSKAAVDTVEELRARFEILQSRLQKASEVASSETAPVQELLEAKLELAQIVGNIEKFQFVEVDAVETHNLHSGKHEVRQQRKDLTRCVTALGEEAASRHAAVSARIASMSTPDGGGNKNSPR